MAVHLLFCADVRKQIDCLAESERACEWERVSGRADVSLSFTFVGSYTAECTAVFFKVTHYRLNAGVGYLPCEVEEEHYVEASVSDGAALDTYKVHIVDVEFGEHTVKAAFLMGDSQHYRYGIGIGSYLHIL